MRDHDGSWCMTSEDVYICRLQVLKMEYLPPGGTFPSKDVILL